MKKLILFDIDGILIKPVSMGTTTGLVKKYWNLDVSKLDLYLEGKTFRQCLIEKLTGVGVKDPESDPNFEIALRDASPILEALEQGKSYEIIEGVENLIKNFRERGYVLGLLTGNSPESAQAKLESIDFWKYFDFGGFGHATNVRSELVPIAVKQAEEKTGIKFDLKDVFLIGDTIEDIKCAKESGAKIIAVATGKEGVEQLKKKGPDFLFKDFSDVKKILEAIE